MCVCFTCCVAVCICVCLEEHTDKERTEAALIRGTTLLDTLLQQNTPHHHTHTNVNTHTNINTHTTPACTPATQHTTNISQMFKMTMIPVEKFSAPILLFWGLCWLCSPQLFLFYTVNWKYALKYQSDLHMWFHLLWLFLALSWITLFFSSRRAGSIC